MEGITIETNYVIWGTIGVIAALLALFAYFNHVRNKKILQKITAQYGKVPDRKYDERDLNSCRSFFDILSPTQGVVDDITWNDLNMDLMYSKINNTQSSVGDEYLYNLLRKQQDNDLPHFEEMTTFFAQNPESRLKLQRSFYDIGKTTNNSLLELLADPSLAHKAPVLFVAVAAVIGVLAFGLIPVSVDIAVLVLTATFSINLSAYTIISQKINPTMIIIRMFIRLVKSGKKIAKANLPNFEKENAQLKKDLAHFKNMDGLTAIIFDQSQPVIVFLVAYLGLYAFAYKRILKVIHENTEATLSLYKTIGYLETCISVASYRESVAYFCKPKFTQSTEITAEEIVHPLLKHPVANTKTLQNKVLITGSNASGKSTFAKTLALNVILGQTIHTCLAEQFAFQPCLVYTSMNMKDDIDAGDSFYVAEVKSLKRLIDIAKGNTYTMIFIDELFKGTNMVERVAAASSILKFLAEQNCFVCLTTHDIELTKILENYYENYHFQEQITDDELFFDYKIRDGVTTGSNAIQLLKYCKYDQDIVTAAKTMAESYEENKNWPVYSRETAN